MSDSRDRRTQLLAETFHGDWADGPAAAMAQRAAAHARRRRVFRSAAVATVVAVAVMAVISIGNRPRISVAPPSAPVLQSSYEIISDDELVALLRDRPLLVLPQETGPARFVVLNP